MRYQALADLESARVSGQRKAINEIMRRYALKEDGHEKGASKQRFESRHLNQGGAAGYIAMYKLVEDRQNKGTYIYKSYRLEVLVREADWTIMHFQYMP